MHILLITDGMYPFVMGGMQKHSYYLAKYFSKTGVKVHIVHPLESQEQDESEMSEFSDFQHENVSFTRIQMPSPSRLPGHYIRESKKYSDLVFNALKQDLSIYDLIYAQGFTGWRFALEARRKSFSIPVFTNIHGYEMYQKAPSIKVKMEHLLLRGITRETVTNSDFIFSFGGVITEILKKRLSVPENRILECSIGIEPSWLIEGLSPAKEGKLKFVFLGRYERRKGVQELTSALERILKKRKDFEFHFIGPIHDERKINSSNIIYHGEIRDEAKIKQILRSCDILVCPSYSEGMPTVIMEAMASGLAILATNVGAISQQVSNNENGWLIEKSDPIIIQDTLELAIQTDNETLHRLKCESLKKVKEKFLWDKVIIRKTRLMEDVLIKAESVKSC